MLRRDVISSSVDTDVTELYKPFFPKRHHIGLEIYILPRTRRASHTSHYFNSMAAQRLLAARLLRFFLYITRRPMTHLDYWFYFSFSTPCYVFFTPSPDSRPQGKRPVHLFSMCLSSARRSCALFVRRSDCSLFLILLGSRAERCWAFDAVMVVLGVFCFHLW
jgi:hypothetical protein